MPDLTPLIDAIEASENPHISEPVRELLFRFIEFSNEGRQSILFVADHNRSGTIEGLAAHGADDSKLQGAADAIGLRFAGACAITFGGYAFWLGRKHAHPWRPTDDAKVVRFNDDGLLSITDETFATLPARIASEGVAEAVHVAPGHPGPEHL